MKCKYCKKNTDCDFCNESCEQKYNEYFELEKKMKYWCLLGVFGGFLLMILGAIVKIKLLVPVGLFVWGLTMVLLPLMTSTDVKWFGVKNSIIMIRLIGIIFIVAAIVLAIVWII